MGAWPMAPSAAPEVAAAACRSRSLFPRSSAATARPHATAHGRVMLNALASRFTPEPRPDLELDLSG